MRIILTLLCVATLSYSCTSPVNWFKKKNGNLTQRYKTSTPTSVGPGIENYVRVGAFFYREEDPATPPARKRLVADLPSDALAEFIKQAGTMERNSDKLVAKLNAGIGNRPPVVEEFIDLTRISRRLVVSVKDLLPTDVNRITKVDVRIKIPDEFRLLSCNRFQTLFETVDFGKLNFSRGIQAKIGANLSTGVTGGVSSESVLKSTTGAGADEFNTTGTESSNTSSTSTGNTASQGVNAELSASRSFAEEVLLRQRLVLLNAMIEGNTLVLSQEGSSFTKIGGNVTADITLDARLAANTTVATERTYDFAELVDENDGYTAPAKVKVSDVLISYPNLTGDLTAEVSFNAVYREVIKDDGDKTISESDDGVNLLFGATDPAKARKVVILYEREYKPTFWVITKTGSPVPEVRMFSPATGGSGALLFNSYPAAKSFLLWLKGQKFLPPAVTRLKLGAGGHGLELNSGGDFTSTAVANLEINVR